MNRIKDDPSHRTAPFRMAKKLYFILLIKKSSVKKSELVRALFFSSRKIV